jgi:hypothetical protein
MVRRRLRRIACWEMRVISQGHLFECAPSAVKVLMAAIAYRSVPEPNRGAVLDMLCRILAGYPDDSETEAGNGDLDEQCRQEALKGYWSLMRVAPPSAGERRQQRPSPAAWPYKS